MEHLAYAHRIKQWYSRPPFCINSKHTLAFHSRPTFFEENVLFMLTFQHTCCILRLPQGVANAGAYRLYDFVQSVQWYA